MSEPVKKKVRVVGAQYSKEAQSFLLVVEAPDVKFSTQIPIGALLSPEVVECFLNFSKEEEKICTDNFCKHIVGKIISVVFDPDLDNKIKDHCPLSY